MTAEDKFRTMLARLDKEPSRAMEARQSMKEIDIPVKKCRGCGEIKPATSEHFGKHKDGKYGLNSKCKPCLRSINLQWLSSPAGKAYQAKYAAENSEARKRYNKAWREANKEKIAEKKAQYRVDNREKLNDADKRKRMKNPEVYSAIRKKWKKKHLGTVRGRIMNSMHVRISKAIKGNKGGESWLSIVGYTYEELKAHLERQFTKGMTWKNYGAHWHIDHITPIAAFDFDSSDKNEVIKQCWALTNLRPLIAVENSRKRHSRQFLL